MYKAPQQEQASGQIQPEARRAGATPGREPSQTLCRKHLPPAFLLRPLENFPSIFKSYGSDRDWRIGENTDLGWNKVAMTGFNNKAAAKWAIGER